MVFTNCLCNRSIISLKNGGKQVYNTTLDLDVGAVYTVVLQNGSTTFEVSQEHNFFRWSKKFFAWPKNILA